MPVDYQAQRVARLTGGVAQTPRIAAPTNILDRIKAAVSPDSTAGILMGRTKKIDEEIKKAGG